MTQQHIFAEATGIYWCIYNAWYIRLPIAITRQLWTIL